VPPIPKPPFLTCAALAAALCGCDSPGGAGSGEGGPWPTRNWEVTSPESGGFAAGFSDRVDGYIRDSLPGLRAAVIVRGGRLVYEHYSPAWGPDSLNDLQSAGKSFVSALVGIALQRGLFRDLDVNMAELLPQGREPECLPQAEAATIGNLLDMTSGIQPGDYSIWSSQKDRVHYALAMPLAHAPGAAFLYSNMGAHLLSASLTAVTGRTALALADSELFAPLGITRREWPADSAGLSTGDGELRLTARDMAKFGYLFLRKGRWEGGQVVPASWVARSTARRSQGGDPEGDAYGYLWWVGAEGKHACYYAAGWGGQLIEVVPDLDLVVAVASGIDSAHRETRRFIGGAVIAGLAGEGGSAAEKPFLQAARP
jgi:CubicO group peptidase (beta-lactamase class C family)